ncbi:hypothetical protein FLX27_26695, partial [Agrobacterium tumefaciens]
TARARTSGENLFVVLLVIAPTSHELGSPAKPVRFIPSLPCNLTKPLSRSREDQEQPALTSSTNFSSWRWTCVFPRP